jgi:hypothetical protein
MPTLAIVDGMKIVVYGNDHGFPHVHVLLAEHRLVVNIETLTVVQGSMPRPKITRVLDWMTTRRRQLLQAWSLCQAGLPTEKIT